MEITTRLHTVPRLGMSGALSPFFLCCQGLPGDSFPLLCTKIFNNNIHYLQLSVTRWQWLFYMCTNMKLVTNKFKSGELHQKHVVATWNLGNHLSICLQIQRNNRKKPCVEVAGRRTFRILTSSQQSGI